MKQKLQKKDLTKHFEAILGRPLGEFEAGVIKLREEMAVWSFESDNGNIMSREIGTTGDSTKACSSSNLFSIGGLASTGENGKIEFLLSDYHCAGVLSISFPIIFVATVQSQEPIFVTSRTFEVYSSGSGNISDVRVELYTWDSNGSPAGSKFVKWFCQFPNFPIIL